MSFYSRAYLRCFGYSHKLWTVHGCRCVHCCRPTMCVWQGSLTFNFFGVSLFRSSFTCYYSHSVRSICFLSNKVMLYYMRRGKKNDYSLSRDKITNYKLCSIYYDWFIRSRGIRTRTSTNSSCIERRSYSSCHTASSFTRQSTSGKFRLAIRQRSVTQGRAESLCIP